MACFEKSGVTSTRVGHTHLSKYISTQTYELGDATEGQAVEKVMSHGAITKRRCYVRTDCTRTASKAMQVIAHVTSSQAKSPSRIADSSSQPPSSIQIPDHPDLVIPGSMRHWQAVFDSVHSPSLQSPKGAFGSVTWRSQSSARLGGANNPVEFLLPCCKYQYY